MSEEEYVRTRLDIANELKDVLKIYGDEWRESVGWINFTIAEYFSVPAFFYAYESAGLGCPTEILNSFNRVPNTETIMSLKKVARTLQKDGYPPF